MSSPAQISKLFLDKSLVKTGMTGATGNIYCGLHEFEDMGFVLHFLRPGDLFVDIGANIGSYTILASVTGAEVISFEPVPDSYEALLDNISHNRLAGRVDARNQAVGRNDGELEMIADQDTTNQAIHKGEQYTGKTVRVPVTTLDKALQGKSPKLIKIDVEGFETEVLAGAESLFTSPDLQAVIMELNGSGEHYGFDEDILHKKLLSQGFYSCTFDPLSRRVVNLKGQRTSSGNTLYLRELHNVQEVVHQSKKYKILGTEL